MLIRAAAPVTGVDVMRARRNGVPDRRLADGPGKLAQAFAITGDVDGMPATTASVLRLDTASKDEARGTVVVTPRIGITRAADWPLRFVMQL